MKRTRLVSRRAKLTPQKVRSIRRAYRGGLSQVELAQQSGVSQSAISMLLRGLTYRRVA